jgi:tetratricopeptide (TPR) repeat protein
MQEKNTMFNNLRAHFVLAALAAILAIPMTVQSADAQERLRIMIPDLTPTDDTRERFGERVADRTRDRLDLARHVAMSQRDIDRAARDFDMRYGDLGCIEAFQLAAQLGVPLVMCGEYRRDGEQILVEASFFTVPAREELPIPPFHVAENQETQAAERLVADFEVLAGEIALIGYCAEQARSQNWTQALDVCGRAAEAVPDARMPRFQLGRAHAELENYQEALDQFQTLLENDPGDDEVLEHAGFNAAQLGETELARDYYSRYLTINPDNVDVRVKVAYDMSRAGDPLGALDLLREGLETNPDHLGLLEQYGTSAFRAALNLQGERPATQDADATQDPEVAELFREAIDALMRVVEVEGEDAQPLYVVNSVRAYMQLGEYDEAIRTADRGVEIFPDNADIWSERATAANRAGQTSEAVASLERALEINPDLQRANTRMGTYYLESGQIDNAIRSLRAAADAGEQGPDALAGIILSRAWNDHINPQNNLPEGIRLVEAAKEFDVSPEFREQLNFFHGYGLFRRGEQVEAPETVESARQALPIFREAKAQLEAARGHGQRNPGLNIAQFIENSEIFIERQERIIERGGNRR